jgi:hypothetical protein
MSELPVRRYNEKEVSRLLKRASELQRSSPRAATPAGLTLKELEDIAREAGLDVGMLRQAANELERSPVESSVAEKLAGAPSRIVVELTLPYEADETQFASLLPAIENAFGAGGHVGQVGRTFTWSTGQRNSGRTGQVRVGVGRGETQIRIEEAYGALMGGLFGGVLGGVGGAVGLGAAPAVGMALGLPVLAVGLPILVIGGSYWGLRTGFRGYVTRRRRTLEQLLHDLSQALRVNSEAV